MADEGFEAWFREALARYPTSITGSAKATVWRVTQDLLDAFGVRPSAHQLTALQDALFLLRIPVGLTLDANIAEFLNDVGFNEKDRRGFLPLAYKLNGLRTVLQQAQGEMKWEALLTAARSFPVSPTETATRSFLEASGGAALKRALDGTGQGLPAAALPHGYLADEFGSPRDSREAARLLRNALRAHGVYLDTDRLIRTQMARARCLAHWEADSRRGHWKGETLIFRQTASNPCRECLRLHKNLDGRPQLYRVDQVRVSGCLRTNRGSRRLWVTKIGPIHCNCRCGPWVEWIPAMASIFAPRAPEYAALIRRLGLE